MITQAGKKTFRSPKSYGAKAHKEIRRISKQAGYSLHDARAHLNKDVIFFASDKYSIGVRQYHAIPTYTSDENEQHKIVIADVVSAAALNLNLFTSDPDVSQILRATRKERLAVTQGKIEKIFEVAQMNETNFCILGALGCGAFKNPADEVARVFNLVIEGLKQKFQQAQQVQQVQQAMPPISFAIYGKDKSTIENRTAFEYTFGCGQITALNEDKLGAILQKIRVNIEALVLHENVHAIKLLAELESSYTAGYDLSTLKEHAESLNSALEAVLKYKNDSKENPGASTTDAPDKIKALQTLATHLMHTPNYKARGILLMALGAVLTTIGALAFAAGMVLAPTGAGSLPGLIALTVGSATTAAGVGLFSSGVKNFRLRENKAALRERGTELNALLNEELNTHLSQKTQP